MHSKQIQDLFFNEAGINANNVLSMLAVKHQQLIDCFTSHRFFLLQIGQKVIISMGYL